MRTQLFEAKEWKKVIPYLQKNQPVVLPTETVYGLAANAESDVACRNIFKLKHRPIDNPLIVHCADIEMAQQYMCQRYEYACDDSMGEQSIQEMIDWYENTYNRALKILNAFAPGPVSVITFATNKVSTVARAGSRTVAIRIPAHAIFRDLITVFGKPLAAPSANVSGLPSPTNALMAWEAMSGRVSAIVDGGQCDIGLESTIIDCTGVSLYGNSINKYQEDNGMYNNSVCIVRTGNVSAHDIYTNTGLETIDFNKNYQKDIQKIQTTDISGISNSNPPIITSVPGSKYRHYAPHAKVIPLYENIFDMEDKEDDIHSKQYKELLDTTYVKRYNMQYIDKIVHENSMPLLQKYEAYKYSNIGLVLGPVVQKVHQLLYDSIANQKILSSIVMARIFSSWQELAQRLYEYFATSDRLFLDALFVCVPHYSCHSALYDRIKHASYT